jgi:hypothetical protein
MRPLLALAAAAAAATLVLAPVAAFAALPQPAVGPIDAPTVGYLVDVAESYWQPDACAGRTQVHAVSRTDAMTAARSADPSVAGFADLGSALWPAPSCDVWIVDDVLDGWSVRGLCDVITHEIGHTLGYRHVNDPTNAMNPTVISCGPPSCDAAQAQIMPTQVRPPAPAVDPVPGSIDGPPDDVDAPAAGRPTRWPTPRVLRIGRDAHGRVALRIANSASPRLTVRFYRGADLGGKLVKTVVARVDQAAFENSAATAVIVAPARWDAVDVQLTGGPLKPGTGRWLQARVVQDWPDARGPVSGQAAPSAGAEFGGDRGARPSPVLSGQCGNPLRCAS